MLSDLKNVRLSMFGKFSHPGGMVHHGLFENGFDSHSYGMPGSLATLCYDDQRVISCDFEFQCTPSSVSHMKTRGEERTAAPPAAVAQSNDRQDLPMMVIQAGPGEHQSSWTYNLDTHI